MKILGIHELDPVQAMALTKALKLSEVNDENELPQGSSASVDFCVHLTGDLTRGEAKSRAGTNRALTAMAFIATLDHMGFMRDVQPDKIVEAWKHFGSLTRSEIGEHKKRLEPEAKARFEDCERLFEDKVVNELPRIPTRGYLKFYPSN
jgi:hypothetical protein